MMYRISSIRAFFNSAIIPFVFLINFANGTNATAQSVEKIDILFAITDLALQNNFDSDVRKFNDDLTEKIDFTNEALLKSGITGKIIQSVGISTLDNCIQTAPSTVSQVAAIHGMSDICADKIHAEREKVGADMVVVYSENFNMFGDMQYSALGSINPIFTMSLANAQAMKNDNMLLARILGATLGAANNIDNSQNISPVDKLPYAYGFNSILDKFDYSPPDNFEYKTIMSMFSGSSIGTIPFFGGIPADSGLTKYSIGQFSNPLVPIYAPGNPAHGKPSGGPNQNVAKLINDRFSLVANIYPAVAIPPVDVNCSTFGNNPGKLTLTETAHEVILSSITNSTTPNSQDLTYLIVGGSQVDIPMSGDMKLLVQPDSLTPFSIPLEYTAETMQKTLQIHISKEKLLNLGSSVYIQAAQIVDNMSKVKLTNALHCVFTK